MDKHTCQKSSPSRSHVYIYTTPTADRPRMSLDGGCSAAKKKLEQTKKQRELFLPTTFYRLTGEGKKKEPHATYRAPQANFWFVYALVHGREAAPEILRHAPFFLNGLLFVFFVPRWINELFLEKKQKKPKDRYGDQWRDQPGYAAHQNLRAIQVAIKKEQTLFSVPDSPKRRRCCCFIPTVKI